MELSGALIIVLYIVVGFLAFRFLRGALKVALVLLVLTLVILGTFGFFVYRDVVDIKANLKNGNMVLLMDNGAALSGFSVTEHEPHFFSKEELSALSSQYASKDLDGMLGKNYKLMIVDMKAIESIENFEITFEDGSALSKADAIKALRSDTLMPILSGKMDGATDPEETKAMLFALIFTQHFIQDPAFAITSLKKDTLIVYPQTAIFKAVRYVPVSMIKSLGEKSIEKGGEVKDVVMEKIG